MEAGLSARTPRYQGEGAGKLAPSAFICCAPGSSHLMSNRGDNELCRLLGSLCLLTSTCVLSCHPSPGLQMLDFSGARDDIASLGCRVERELKRWEPEGLLGNMSLDMPAGKGGRSGHWDQFEANRKMFQVRSPQPPTGSHTLLPFQLLARQRHHASELLCDCCAGNQHLLPLQVKSTWDENLYTTKLDPTKIGISRDEADRLAREIEGSVAGNRHLAEERNQSRDTGEEVSSPATLSPSHTIQT